MGCNWLQWPRRCADEGGDFAGRARRRIIAKRAAEHLKPVLPELGGKARI